MTPTTTRRCFSSPVEWIAGRDTGRRLGSRRSPGERAGSAETKKGTTPHQKRKASDYAGSKFQNYGGGRKPVLVKRLYRDTAELRSLLTARNGYERGRFRPASTTTGSPSLQAGRVMLHSSGWLGIVIKMFFALMRG